MKVLDEIYSRCDHVAPWAPGTSRVPSTAFCLLMKLFVMKLTRPQMNEILVHEVGVATCRGHILIYIFYSILSRLSQSFLAKIDAVFSESLFFLF